MIPTSAGLEAGAVGRDFYLMYDHQTGKWCVQNEPFKVIRTGADVIHTKEITAPGIEWESQVADLVRSVAEWDDRTSPEDYPDHLLLTPQELTEFARSVATISSAVPEPAVKMLKWVDHTRANEEGEPIIENLDVQAQSSIGNYYISYDPFVALKAPIVLNMPVGRSLEGFKTEGAAKAAAQADYETRIRSALIPPSRAVDGELPLWRTGSWGDGSTPPYLANIFCDAHEATIAAGLPKGIVTDIVEAHNDALTALSAERAEAGRWSAEWHGRYVVAEARATDLRRKLEEAQAIARSLDERLDASRPLSDRGANG